MSFPFAIKTDDVSKLYHLGERAQYGKTFRETIVDSLNRVNPFSRLRSSGSANGHADLWALNGVSFEIRPGEVVGVIGRNGAGKSTLLKILSRITEPTRGRAEIYGRIGSLLEVGTGFHPELSGRENIYLNGSILGMTRREIESKFDEIVAFAELERFIDTPVKRYSSGMYVRLAFAVAAHLEPEILLVDEVLAVGDAAFQKKCIGKMSDVAKHGRTILFVSHNTAALLNLCDRGLLLDKGKLVEDGAIEPVIQKYLKGLRTATPWDLTSYDDRQGRGKVRFTRVRFEDGSGNTVEHGISGEPLVVVLDYESVDDRPLPNCRVSVVFFDGLGQALFNCVSELVIHDPITLPPSGTIRCIVPRLPLSQNQYVLTLFLDVNREIEDWIHNAIELNVVDGDFYGTGRLYPEGWRGKGVLVPHSWTVESK
ncbi:MAG: Vitamin B12 import ATP-binding protein BtuD [Acidobacteria bacterium]|nr:Vitamin B12 import ATP-binding protein BtuD [Acidobacteriota bacterium]